MNDVSTCVRANIFYILFFLPLFSFAQYELSGSVKDDSGAIEFANVILKNTEDETTVGSITDTEGKFKLEAPEGSYILTISFIGYKDYTQEISLTQNLSIGDVSLAENVSQLGEVVVTGKRKVVERHMDKLFFHVENSYLKTGFDGMEVIKRAPSVYVDASDNILLRNKTATVLVNGKKLNFSGAELANYIKSLDAKNIKRIEIQEVASAETDATSDGGVINFILNSRETGFSATLKAYYTQLGSNPEYTSSANLNYGSKKWNIYGILFYKDREDNGDARGLTTFNTANRQHRETTLLFEDYKYLSGNIGATFELWDKHNLGLEFYTTSDDYFVRNESILDVHIDDEIFDSAENASFRNSDPRYYNTSVNYSVALDTLGSKLRFIGDYALQDLENDFGVNALFGEHNIEDAIDRGATEATTNIFAGQLDYNKKVGKLGELYAGAKMSSTHRKNESVFESFVDSSFTIDDDRSFYFDFQENIYASYLTLSRKFGETVSAKVGLRVERTDLDGEDLQSGEKVKQDYTDFFPSFFISKSFKNNHYLSFNYSRRIRRPGFSILNPNTSRTNAFNLYTGNPNLLPEYRNNFVLTYDLSGGHSFSAYHYLIDNKILGVFALEDEVITVHRYQNVGRANTTGVEYNFSKDIKNWWYFKVGASVFRRNFSLPDRSTERNTASINFDTDWTLPENWLINLSGSYISSSADGYYVRADNFATNFMLQKTFLDKKLKVRLYVDDVFDTLRTQSEGTFDPFTVNFYQKKNTQQFTLWVLYTIASKKKVRNNRNDSSNDVRNRL